MARGRVGGTRSKVSGKIGSQVYQIQKGTDGTLQQVVYSKPESYARVNTPDIAKNKMKMSVVERAMGVFRDIVASSFEGVPEGTESVSEWSRANIELIAADMQEHWDTVGSFDYTRKDVPGATAGRYLISRGTLIYGWAGTVIWNYYTPYTFIYYSMYIDGAQTVGHFKELQNLKAGDYYTMVLLVKGLQPQDTCVRYIRMIVDDELSDDTIITRGNAWRLMKFATNGPVTVTFDPDGCVYKFTYNPREEPLLDRVIGWGIIRSSYIDGKWRKSTQYLKPYWWSGTYANTNVKPSDVYDTWYNETE